MKLDTVSLSWAITTDVVERWNKADPEGCGLGRLPWPTPLEINLAVSLCLRLRGIDPLHRPRAMASLVEVDLSGSLRREDINVKPLHLALFGWIKRVLKPHSPSAFIRIRLLRNLDCAVIEFNRKGKELRVEVLNYENDGASRGLVSYIVTTDLKKAWFIPRYEEAAARKHDSVSPSGAQLKIREIPGRIHSRYGGLSPTASEQLDDPAHGGESQSGPCGQISGVHSFDFEHSKVVVKEASR